MGTVLIRQGSLALTGTLGGTTDCAHGFDPAGYTTGYQGYPWRYIGLTIH
jgi:hypothetical protein